MIIYAILRRKVPDKQNLQSNLKFSRFVEYIPVTISVQISHIAPKYVCVCIYSWIYYRNWDRILLQEAQQSKCKAREMTMMMQL